MSAIAVPLQKPLVTGRPQMLSDPRGISALIDPRHPGAEIVLVLILSHPREIARFGLRYRTGHDGKEPRHAAVFEWLILRINDTLPLTGWRIGEDRECYRLEKISQKHHERLLEQHK